jgi:Tol biopolymer transport system component
MFADVPTDSNKPQLIAKRKGDRMRSFCAWTVALVCLLTAGAPHARESVRFQRLTSFDVNDFVTYPTISADGRYVAYATAQLTGPESYTQILLHDRVEGTTRMVTRGNDGGDANGGSNLPMLSGDGQYLCFTSNASNLTNDDTDDPAGFYEQQDLFVYDRLVGTTELVSTGVPDAPDGAAIFWNACKGISDDGNLVLMWQHTYNYNDGVSGDNMYLRDRAAGTSRLLAEGAVPTSLTPDGTVAAFDSTRVLTGEADHPDMGAGDVPDSDVFTIHTTTGAIERSSLRTDGIEGVGSSGGGHLSGDGRYVAFFSGAANLVDGQDRALALYLKDRISGSTTRISLDLKEYGPYDGITGVSISRDGAYVAYNSVPSTIYPGRNDIFVYRVQTGDTQRIPIDAEGHEFDELLPVISGDGRYISFMTDAALVGQDTNDLPDVYVLDRFDAESSSLRIRSPRQPERDWNIGASHRVSWTYTGTATAFDIAISRDGGASWTLLSRVQAKPGRGQHFEWTAVGTPGPVTIRVQAVGDAAAEDTTDLTMIAGATGHGSR